MPLKETDGNHTECGRCGAQFATIGLLVAHHVEEHTDRYVVVPPAERKPVALDCCPRCSTKLLSVRAGLWCQRCARAS